MSPFIPETTEWNNSGLRCPAVMLQLSFLYFPDVLQVKLPHAKLLRMKFLLKSLLSLPARRLQHRSRRLPKLRFFSFLLYFLRSSGILDFRHFSGDRRREFRSSDICFFRRQETGVQTYVFVFPPVPFLSMRSPFLPFYSFTLLPFSNARRLYAQPLFTFLLLYFFTFLLLTATLSSA